jgi:pyruvate kinase
MSGLEAIVESADAVMVARGDLGVEVPLHQVPVFQKRIIETGRRHGKPVIVATQMLESMMEQPRPTRAEASDCANAVFDGADALMLSGETAAGQFPVDSVRTMGRIITEAESFRRTRPRAMSSDLDGGYGPLIPNATEAAQLNPQRDRNLHIPEVVASAAVLTANRLGARQIVAFSQGGFTARMIARYRPRTPILVFTKNREVARRVQLLWGARPLLMEHEVDHHDEVVSVVDGLLIENELAEPGDTIVILMGDPVAERPLTNLMRVHRVRNTERLQP